MSHHHRPISSPPTSNLRYYQRSADRIASSKRKLEDYYVPPQEEEDDFSDLTTVRMKKSDAITAVNSDTRVSQQSVLKSLHFFVRMISGGKTIVIHANSDDLVESVHEQIWRISGIPVYEQRLIYRGRQLSHEQTLKQCLIENDAGLSLVGRMRSTANPQTWTIVNDLDSSIRHLCKAGGASKVDSMHLDYFHFCGRMIALALLNKIQVGIVFDRIFFLQLAGSAAVSLEDVRDADPCLYMSCTKILEMDAEFLDSDDLGLSFVLEVEELGSRKVVELCPGGKTIVVNSKNREEYVNLLIQHRFVTSISEQVARFAKGFADILSDSGHQKLFFQSLKLEDLDRMLHGSDSTICVKDWKAHTDYHGYKETDRQICWFWKVLEGMPTDQRRLLLFFWTSIKYLPMEGFRGLASRLQIYKGSDSHDRLPSSHTCFYRLCIPAYPSKAAMRDCLNFITQEHVSSSFGTW